MYSYKELKNSKGIYKITCTSNGRIYIGSTVFNFYNRWHQHVSALKRKEHHSVTLQRAYDKYGKDAFVYEIIEKLTDDKEVLEREQYYIDLYDSANPKLGFNICKFAGNHKGMTHSEESKELTRQKSKKNWENPEYRKKVIEGATGLKREEETKQKQSEAAKSRFSSEGARRQHSIACKGVKKKEGSGEKQSKIMRESCRVLGANNPKAKLNEEKVREIRQLYTSGGYTYKQIGELYGVTHYAIADVITRRKWSHVE